MAIGILTGVLVLITAYYAFHTQRMASEMVLARQQAVAPHLVMSIAYVGNGVGVVRVTNVGQGAALDAYLELTFQPPHDRQQAAHVIHWTPSVVTPFERSDFYMPGRPHTYMRDFAETYPRVTLQGTVKDTLGNESRVDDEIDVARYYGQTKDEYTKLGYDPQEVALRTVGHQLEQASRSIHDLVEVGRGTDFYVRWRDHLPGFGRSGRASSTERDQPAAAENPEQGDADDEK